MTKEELFDKMSLAMVPDGQSVRTAGIIKHSDRCTIIAIEYAKQQTIAFDKWKWDNRWFNFENGYWYQTHEQGTAMSEKTYNKYHRKTPEELYNQFIEQQNKEQ